MRDRFSSHQLPLLVSRVLRRITGAHSFLHWEGPRGESPGISGEFTLPGLLMFNFIVYLNEGSLLIMLAWLVPTMILGNIIPLIYFVVNFHSLVSHFM